MDPCSPETHRHLKGLLQRLPETPPVLLWVKEASSPARMGEQLLVFPASFNPPTKAHLSLLAEGRVRSGAKEAVVVVDHRPVDKELASTTLDRLLMLMALFQDDPQVSIAVANRGLFLDKLRALERERPEAKVVFLMGWDTLLRLFDPRYYDDPTGALGELFSKAYVMVALRGEASRGDLERFLNGEETRAFRGKISTFDLPEGLRSISATEVRERVKRGRPVGDLVPELVERYITKRGLYR